MARWVCSVMRSRLTAAAAFRPADAAPMTVSVRLVMLPAAYTPATLVAPCGFDTTWLPATCPKSWSSAVKPQVSSPSSRAARRGATSPGRNQVAVEAQGVRGTEQGRVVGIVADGGLVARFAAGGLGAFVVGVGEFERGDAAPVGPCAATARIRGRWAPATPHT